MEIGEAGQALEYLRRIDMTLYPHDDLLNTALQGANETEQAVYDWIYLSLALSLSCPLITADRKFFLAIRKTRFKKDVIWIENIPESS